MNGKKVREGRMRGGVKERTSVSKGVDEREWSEGEVRKGVGNREKGRKEKVVQKEKKGMRKRE